MVIAGIVAGGSGRRMGGDIPKQFYDLNGKPVIIYTTEAFLNHGNIDCIIIGINPDWADYTKELIKKYFPDNENIFITNGGSDRNGTIMNMISFAYKELSCDDKDIILTHDAVRPFVSREIISESITKMNECEICTAAIPETDTVIESDDGKTALAFPDRSRIFRVQTPQTFRLGTFRSVYGNLSESERAAATDVCRLYKSKGYNVSLITGDPSNIKLTYPHDYRFAQAQTDNKA